MTDPANSELMLQTAEPSTWSPHRQLPSGTQSAPDHFPGNFPGFRWRESPLCAPEFALSRFLPEELTSTTTWNRAGYLSAADVSEPPARPASTARQGGSR